MREITTFFQQKEVDGFTVQPGFVGIMENGQLVAVTSGWESQGDLFIYQKIADRWVGRWEDEYEYEEAAPWEGSELNAMYKALQDYKEMVETWLSVQYLNDHKPKILTRITKFWVSGREMTYRPIQGLPGVYEVSWWMDGQEVSEIRALTARAYRNLRIVELKL